MAQKGYFSGKKEYDRKQPGQTGGKGGYNTRSGGSDRPGGKGGYEARNGERPRNDDRGNGERTGGYGRQGQYGKSDGSKPGGYNRSNDSRDSDSRGYGKQGGYGKPGGYNRSNDSRDGDNRGYGKQGGYGERRNGERPRYENRNGERPRYDERRMPEAQNPDAENVQQGEADELPFLIIGRNAVREAVKAGRSIDRILVSAEPDGSLREIVSLARDRKILVRETARKALDELCLPFGHGGKTANHQGVVAYAAGVTYCSVQDILDVAKSRGEQPFVIVLDGVMDPHNLGSIIRSADCAGAHGVVIGKRRSASVTAATVKAAAGATEHVAIARVTNIPTALAELKKAGVWIAGADMAGAPMTEKNLSGALAFVIGNEGEGLGKLVGQSCDFLVSIPMLGQLDSLNASVAAGVLMFEKRRQDAAALVKA